MKPLLPLIFSISMVSLSTHGIAAPRAAVIGDGSAQVNRSIVHVLVEESVDSEQTFTLEDLLSNIDNFVQTPENGLPWHSLGATKQIPYSATDQDGLEVSGVKPEFTPDLLKMDGQTVLMQGYMFPLDPDEKQSMFLFGPFPVSCPFHYHVTPNLIVEVHAKTPIMFSYDAVTIRGRLELVPKDDEFNVFFRIRAAVLVR